MNTRISTEEYRGYTIALHIDADARNPRKEFDCAGTLATFGHGRNTIDHLADKYHGFEEFLSEWKRLGKGGVFVPFWYNAHSPSFSVGDDWNDKSDLPTADGVLFIRRKKIEEEWSKRYPRRKVADALKAELKEFGAWLLGEVYGYVIEDGDSEEVDSRWGFYGEDDYALSEARNTIDAIIHSAEERAAHNIALIPFLYPQVPVAAEV